MSAKGYAVSIIWEERVAAFLVHQFVRLLTELPKFVVLALFAVVVMLFFPLPSLAGSQEKPVITIALVDTFSPSFYINQYAPTLDKLMQSMSRYKFRVIEIDYRRVDKEIRELRPNFLVTSASTYASLMGSLGTQQIAALTPKTSKTPSETVASTFIVRADTPYQSIKDLKGKRVVISERRSFDGWQIALGELKRQRLGIDDFFGDVLETEYGMPDIASVVRIGFAEVGVLSTCEWESLLASGLISEDEFRILDEKPQAGGCRRSTERYPGVVFSSLPWTDPTAVRDATVAVLSMPETRDEYMWMVGGDFVPTFRLLETLEIGPFARPNKLTFDYLWSQWKTEILLGMMLLAAVLFHVVTINLLVRRRTRELVAATRENERFHREAQAAREELMRLERNNIVSHLSSMFAHEIKQPVMNISLYAESLRMLLKNADLSPEESEKASWIFDALSSEVQRSADIVEHVRSYAKKRPRQFVKCDLAEIVHDAVRMLDEPLALHNHLEGPLIVRADPFELLYVVSNFVRNASAAVKDQPKGCIEIYAQERDGNWVVTVSDNGPAISDEIFSRLGKTGASTKTDGLGFGLAIAAAIMESNGGHLEFERIEPHGLNARLVIARAEE